MKKLLPLLILLQSNLINAQITFQKTYGIAGKEWGLSLCKARDGGFIMAGTSQAVNTIYIYTVKTDSAGVLQQSTLYGSATDGPQMGNINPTSDGGYIVSGFIINHAGATKALLIKLDAQGHIQWTKNYGTGSEIVGSTVQTADHGFISIGTTGNQYMYFFKTDSLGTQQWSRVISGSTCCGNNYGRCVNPTADGNYLIAGDIIVTPSISSIYLSKITPNDTVLWEKTFSAPNNLSVGSVQQTADKGFIISGDLTNKFCLIKTDSSGNFLWGKQYIWKNSNGNSVIQTIDGGYALLGSTSPYKNILLLKTASDGTLQWAKAYGDTTISGSYSNAGTVLQNSDKGYAIGGYTDNGSGAGQEFYLIKTDSLGNSNCYDFPVTPIVNNFTVNTGTQSVKSTLNGDSTITLTTRNSGTQTVYCYQISGIDKIQQQNNIIIYPNPASNQITITTEQNIVEVKLFDISGKQVQQTKSNVIDVSNLDNGIYFVQINTSEGLFTKKIIMQK